MYCHPSQVRKWAKVMKPKATARQIEQASVMRLAKQKKAAFVAAQLDLFELSAPISNDLEARAA